jgi:peptidoglycan/xylan/chitin deacetylase (PgdA/CDA1 family)
MQTIAASPRTLLYHDVVLEDRWDSSGFSGPDADIYKLSFGEFVDHLDRLQASGFSPGIITNTQIPDSMLTFDDGGASAAAIIAPELERRGWRGHFFVTTGRIDSAGFLDARGIRALHERGHVVGVHSVTHPLAMATLSRPEILREWRLSITHLTEVVGSTPVAASIPGGWYSADVAQAASAAGLRYLFTSEPIARAWRVDGVLCLGRYGIWRGMRPDAPVALATGRGVWPLRQRLIWTGKKVIKQVLGPSYVDIRDRLLAGADGVGSRRSSRRSG